MDSYFDKFFCFPVQQEVYQPHIQYIESLAKLENIFTLELMPMRSEGKDSVMNFFSIETA